MARSKASEFESAQLALPLFAPEGQTLAPPAPRAAAPAPGAPDAPEAAVLRAPVATAPSLASCAPAAPPGLPTFRHPRASREVRLQEHRIAYELKRAKRRSIGFVVTTEGLSVSAPRWVSLADIETALHEKAGWILRKLAEQADRNKRLQQARIEWKDGTCVPFLGETVIVVLDPRATGAVLNVDADALPGVPRLTLHVGLPQQASPEQIRDAVQSWLQRQARRVFEERCQHFAARLGVRYRRLALSSAQTRWGSASADGSIRLNWRLIHFAMPTIDYVVAHELAHLREMNHSPRFWDVVRSVMPDYEQVRGVLKDSVVPVMD
ncbi:MAG TPA: SprT family zinc-dependent metalloprotease [Burkholderiaceae bacterium]|nr:SprT family zinc-dependent metalloprotease [Burkholderiaceae bacterium]